MKQYLLIPLLAVLFAACGGDDDNEDGYDNHDDQLQATAFARVQSNIVGEWYTSKFYNDGSYSDYWSKPLGWLDVNSNTPTYVFKSDGTYQEGSVTGTYKIYKNPYYIENLNYTVPTYIETTPDKSGITSKNGITISEDGYLRIYTIFNLYGTEYADFDDYNANYMYSKR